MYNLRSQSQVPLTGSNPSNSTEFFAPPDPTDYTLRLSEKRRSWIQEYKSSPSKNKDVGSPAWEERLWKFLNKRDERILRNHLQKWLKSYQWISQNVKLETQDEHKMNLKQRKPTAIVHPTRNPQ